MIKFYRCVTNMESSLPPEEILDSDGEQTTKRTKSKFYSYIKFLS